MVTWWKYLAELLKGRVRNQVQVSLYLMVLWPLSLFTQPEVTNFPSCHSYKVHVKGRDGSSKTYNKKQGHRRKAKEGSHEAAETLKLRFLLYLLNLPSVFWGFICLFVFYKSKSLLGKTHPIPDTFLRHSWSWDSHIQFGSKVWF